MTLSIVWGSSEMAVPKGTPKKPINIDFESSQEEVPMDQTLQ